MQIFYDVFTLVSNPPIIDVSFVRSQAYGVVFKNPTSLHSGAKYDKIERFSIGCAFEYVDLGDAEIDNSSPINGLKGSYKNNDLYVFAIYFDWKFGED